MSTVPGVVVALVVLAVAACEGTRNGSDGAQPAPSYPAASPTCEAAAIAILAGWQASIDGVAATPLRDFASGARITNLTDVPIGGVGCDPLEATTIATDRAGGLRAPTATAAIARGIVLADVGEMASFGPGLAASAPLAPPKAGGLELRGVEVQRPGDGATCDDWADHLVLTYQVLLDVVARSGPQAVLEGQAPAEEIAGAVALSDAAHQGSDVLGCDPAEQALAVGERWSALRATGLAANIYLGGLTETTYDQLHDAVAAD